MGADAISVLIFGREWTLRGDRIISLRGILETDLSDREREKFASRYLMNIVDKEERHQDTGLRLGNRTMC